MRRIFSSERTDPPCLHDIKVPLYLHPRACAAAFCSWPRRERGYNHQLLLKRIDCCHASCPPLGNSLATLPNFLFAQEARFENQELKKANTTMYLLLDTAAFT